MNQALDTIGSYLIGGLVVLAIVGLTLTLNNKSQESKLYQITQMSSTAVGQVIADDFDKLGYRVGAGNKILSISSNSIKFVGDLQNNGQVDTVTYSTFTQNNQLYLMRKVSTSGSSSQWSYQLSSFSVEGKDSTGNATNVAANIKSIKISMVEIQSSFADSQNQIGASWVREFFPKNL